MSVSKQERIIFEEIQKKIFYMIPEKWNAIYLYASIIEEPLQKPVGEMYFYYLPKGLLKRNFVNVYQIPSMFNIDEESYNSIIQSLYLSIRKLRDIHKAIKPNLWTNLTITIKNFQFKIEYDYNDIGKNSEFSPYERHVIWRYKNLESDTTLLSKSEKEIINRYLSSNFYVFEQQNKDFYVEGSYKQDVRNIIDYEKTLTIEAAIASQNSEENKLSKEEKKSKKEKKNEIEEPKEKSSILSKNLFDRVDNMKRKNDEIDDDMILSSEFMKKKDP